VPGIDRAGVTAWFARHVAGVEPPLEVERISGGRSNLTYAVRDARGRRWVLRRPPLSGVLPSAHDMAREHRIIAALAATPVPVPPALGLCTDESVTGAPFYVMAFVDGVVPRDEASVRAGLGEAARARAADAMVDALVAIHALEPAAVGLGDLGRPGSYIERQLARWRRQWEQSRTRELPEVDETHRRLAARVPAQQGPSRLVHGDYRLDNLILSPAGEVLAVIDWELATLGDPLADVGLLWVYWNEPGDERHPLGAAPTALPGFPSRRELAERYASRSGRDLSELGFYVAFGYWKLAVILEGVYARSRAGAYGSQDPAADELAGVVAWLARSALDATRG
jgi:aminoglycoside phosphotransferase (APT) family kinase protein